MPDHYAHVRQVKAALIQRLEANRARPGERFLSSRALAARYRVSYQTAHRLLDELAAEGRLERRPRSGTFIPGRPPAAAGGVELIFHPRCERAGSFGAKLIQLLTDRLDRERLDWRLTLAPDADAAAVAPHRLPILWECPTLVAEIARRERPALVLHDRPPPGFGSLFIDSLSSDDFGGGVLAGQLLRRALGPATRIGILAGPRRDPRSKLRIDGLRATGPAFLAHADGWYFEHGHDAAARLLRRRPAGVFCGNDRLAEGLLHWLDAHRDPADRPAVIGFDDAPVAAALDLTTVAIPWQAMVDATIEVVRRRLAGRDHASAHRILHPRPVIRASLPAGPVAETPPTSP